MLFYVSVRGFQMKRNKIPVGLIAEKLNISPATVSRTINHPDLVKPETRELVQKTLNQMGYNSDLCSKPENNKLVIVVVPSINNPFYNEVLNGIKTSMNSHEYNVLLHIGSLKASTYESFLNLCKETKAMGVINLSGRMEAGLLNSLDTEIPVVQCSEYNKDSSVPYTSINDFASAYNATKQIIACGYDKIAIVNGPANFNYAQERLKGFEKALQEENIFLPYHWKIFLPDIGYDIAYSALCQLLCNSANRPNALFCASDVFAISALKAASRFNIKVPDELGIVGFDNIDITGVSIPSITTVNQPCFKLGFTASEMLIERMASPHMVQQPILLETELINRDSLTQYKNNHSY